MRHRIGLVKYGGDEDSGGSTGGDDGDGGSSSGGCGDGDGCGRR